MAAQAAPVELTDQQMDQVAAGVGLKVALEQLLLDLVSPPQTAVTFKAQAVRRLLEGGKGLAETATEPGISGGQLSTWRNGHLAAGSSVALVARKAEQAEVQRLRRENKRLEEEVEILKKAAAFLQARRNGGLRRIGLAGRPIPGQSGAHTSQGTACACWTASSAPSRAASRSRTTSRAASGCGCARGEARSRRRRSPRRRGARSSTACAPWRASALCR